MMQGFKAGAALLALAGAAAAGPAAAQDHPQKPEAADHAAQDPAPAAGEDAPTHHSHADTLRPREPVLLPGYGGGGFTITTTVPEAQAFFSNGLELGAAFAHSAAGAAMAHAVALDPACAMCKWGQALVEGPTINFGKDAKERKPLLKLAKAAAKGAKSGGTEREKLLTAALVERFRGGDIVRRDASYAAAMRDIAARYPLDDEIAVLAADAIFVAAFNVYDSLGEAEAKARLAPAIPLLEGVLARNPDHTPAIHFYIHGEEVLGAPEKAEPYADKLAGLAPNASHLVHMPGHTWFWRGRYAETAQTNDRAVEIGKANAARLGLPGPDGVWGLPYHAHNVIYGLGGALMAGDADIGLRLARPLVGAVEKGEKSPPVMQLLASLGYAAIARFDPGGVAALPEPKAPYLKASWNYAKGEAAATAGDRTALVAALAAIPPEIAKPADGQSQAPEQMLGITRAVLSGRLAMMDGDFAAAASHFRTGAEIEETPAFNEFTDPPAFWYPVRRDVAAALLAAGDLQGAKREAEASLALRMKDPVAEDILARTTAALAANP